MRTLRHALVDAHRHARFFRMFLSEGAPTFWRMLATRETANLLRVFGKASAHETERRRDGVLTESRGIASRASPPRAGASPRRAGGTRAVDRGVVRSVARVPLLDRDTASAEAGPRARRGRDRSSHGPRRASIMSFAPPPPSSSMPKAYAHPPVSPATERDAAAEASSDTRGVLKVRASSRPHPARSLARHASVGKEKPSVRRPSLFGVSV